MNPYSNKGNIRTFSKDVNKLELVWHQDAEDRDIEILEGKGWEMQFDNELPFAIRKGDRIFITEGRIHRVLKGTTDLKIKINGQLRFKKIFS
jgi:quercetin dioxygenase-like cupin family protein